DPSRLVFAPRVPLAEHLARHSAADLFLDTFPCNAHTTASDALWMGLPLVTCNGQSFASRVAASLLQAVGLSELITTGMDEYTALAIALAGDAPRRNRLRTTLADARHKAALFDATTCARHLEQAYTRMVDLRRRGATPEDIYIES
ncbi:MAG TPA: hypothetical protein DEQ90_09865, partial [Halieaceae bacterium]|nr:hypothetical protein [Halieaceae bacterium]